MDLDLASKNHPDHPKTSKNNNPKIIQITLFLGYLFGWLGPRSAASVFEVSPVVLSLFFNSSVAGRAVDAHTQTNIYLYVFNYPFNIHVQIVISSYHSSHTSMYSDIYIYIYIYPCNSVFKFKDITIIHSNVNVCTNMCICNHTCIHT